MAELDNRGRPLTSPRPKSREQAAAEQMMNAEYEYEMLNRGLLKDPIAYLGFDPNMVKLGKNPTDSHFTRRSSDLAEEDTVRLGGDYTPYYGPLAHEVRHRGFVRLNDMYNEDPEAFTEKYGQDAVRVLTELGRELQTELYDNPEDPISETRTMADTLTEVTPYNLDTYRGGGSLRGINGSFYDDESARVGIDSLRQAALDALEADNRKMPVVPEEEEKGFFARIFGYAKGGEVKSMKEQMRLFEEGGLADDGMTEEPVTGNEVPAGSMASEVRDDIDAKLSEGEYVVPADVVRYYGVKFFEDLRSEAKGGLSEMEADGRIGGEPAPMEGAPRISEEEMAMLQAAASKQMGMAEGGMVPASPLNEDQLIENLISVVKNDPNLMNKLGQRGVMLFEGGLVDGYAEGGIVEPTFNPNQWMTVGGSYFGGNQQAPAAAAATPIENRTYRGPNGETITIRFQNGAALDPIPAGYVPEADYTTTNLEQTGSTGRDRGDSNPFQPPQTPTVEREPEDPAVYRGVNFNDPVAAAKAALEGTQGTMGNRLMVGAAGMVNPLLGAAVKQGLVANGLATARANLMVAQQYGTPEQVAEIEAALAEAEKNAPSGVGGLFGNVFGDMLGSGQNLFDDAVAQYEKYGVLTPQGAIDAVTSGAGIGRAKAMTAAEVQAGQDYAKKGDDRDTSWAGGKVATNQDKPTYTSDKERKDAVEKAVAATGVRATGGRARGGLMGKANRT